MFVLRDEITVWRNVKVHVPKDGAGHDTETFRAKLKILKTNEANEVFKRPVENEAGDDIDFTFLREVLIDWQNVKDQDKNDIPFSDEAREQLVQIPYVRLALLEAYDGAARGAKVKN